MIDSHCHLAGREFADDLDAVVARARDAGLVRCLVILAAEDDDEFAQARQSAAAWPEVRYAIGVHPHQAHQFSDAPERAAAADGRAARRHRAMRVAVGEIGLDYHYDFTPRDVQQAVFRAQLRLARERRLPVVIHTREAEDDTLRIIGEESGGETARRVSLFFGRPCEAARRALATGFDAFDSGDRRPFRGRPTCGRRSKVVPADRLLIETDSPYLAPVPLSRQAQRTGLRRPNAGPVADPRRTRELGAQLSRTSTACSSPELGRGLARPPSCLRLSTWGRPFLNERPAARSF